MVAALVGLRETLVGAAQPPDDRAVATDRLNAIAGFEFKQSLPVIKDSDFDFERHVREFQSILDCHTFGRRGIRPYDQLTVFRKTLPAGSVRLKVYDTAVKRARKAGKLPHDAKDVYDDIIVKLRTVIFLSFWCCTTNSAAAGYPREKGPGDAYIGPPPTCT